MSNGIVILPTNLSVDAINSNNTDIIDCDIKYDIRTNDNRMDTFSIPSQINNNDDENERDDDVARNSVNIFRFKFTQEFMDELFKFSKIHQYDNRKDFKEAWKIWSEENDELISIEMRRLINLGYEGDILDKMFKSARYYYRKKGTEKKAPKQRRVYMGLQKELLESMDNHINDNIDNDEFKPSTGFEMYCNEYVELLKIEINRLLKNGITDSQEIKNKIKKTYKNRYFIVISK